MLLGAVQGVLLEVDAEPPQVRGVVGMPRRGAAPRGVRGRAGDARALDGRVDHLYADPGVDCDTVVRAIARLVHDPLELGEQELLATDTKKAPNR